MSRKGFAAAVAITLPPEKPQRLAQVIQELALGPKRYSTFKSNLAFDTWNPNTIGMFALLFSFTFRRRKTTIVAGSTTAS